MQENLTAISQLLDMKQEQVTIKKSYTWRDIRRPGLPKDRPCLLVVIQYPVLQSFRVVVPVAFYCPDEQKPRPRPQDDRQKQEENGRPHSGVPSSQPQRVSHHRGADRHEPGGNDGMQFARHRQGNRDRIAGKRPEQVLPDTLWPGGYPAGQLWIIVWSSDDHRYAGGTMTIPALLRKARFIAVPLALSCLLALPAGCGRTASDRVQGYVEGEFLYLSSPHAGQLSSLSVERGAQVKAGDPLFALDSVPEQTARDEAARRLAQARANLARGPGPRLPCRTKSFPDRKTCSGPEPFPNRPSTAPVPRATRTSTVRPSSNPTSRPRGLAPDPTGSAQRKPT